MYGGQFPPGMPGMPMPMGPGPMGMGMGPPGMGPPMGHMMMGPPGMGPPMQMGGQLPPASIPGFAPMAAEVKPSMAAPPTPASRALHVGNLHPHVTDELLFEIFAMFTPIEGVKLVREQVKGKPAKTNYAIVEFFEQSAAQFALEKLHGKVIYGKDMQLSWASKR